MDSGNSDSGPASFRMCPVPIIPPTWELCPEMASGCPRQRLAKGTGFIGAITAEMNVDMFVQLSISL